MKPLHLEAGKIGHTRRNFGANIQILDLFDRCFGVRIIVFFAFNFGAKIQIIDQYFVVKIQIIV